jgi:hypothetical protein
MALYIDEVAWTTVIVEAIMLRGSISYILKSRLCQADKIRE